MTLLTDLSRLSAICLNPRPVLADVGAACSLVQEALKAEEAYVIRAGDPYFVRLGSDQDPTTYEVKQKGYWLAWREMATAGAAAMTARVEGRILMEGEGLACGTPATHVAVSLPSRESNSELLIVRGPWPNGLSQEESDFIIAARPMVAALVCSLLDAEAAARRGEELKGLADVAKAFSEAREMDKVLESVATALAAASHFDWVVISLFDGALKNVVERALNVTRHSSTETAQMAKDGRLGGQSGNARSVVRSGRPVLVPDVFAPEVESTPEARAYYERAHILSTAIFPVVFQGRALGTITFSSATKRDFPSAEVDLLAALVTQSATTIQGLRLYRDLEQSRAELECQAEKLAEVSQVQHFLARTDSLTGIPNRRYAEEVLEAECARSKRYGQKVSVIMSDLDGFKAVNDSYGHHTGDEALRFVASLARKTCRTADFVGRWGGDEFVFILPQTALADAAEFAERFRAALARADFVAGEMGEPTRMTISAGVAEVDANTYSKSDLLLDRADQSLYAAKRQGGNTVVCFRSARAAA